MASGIRLLSGPDLPLLLLPLLLLGELLLVLGLNLLNLDGVGFPPLYVELVVAHQSRSLAPSTRSVLATSLDANLILERVNATGAGGISDVCLDLHLHGSTK